jgi:hypothetical protein
VRQKLQALSQNLQSASLSKATFSLGGGPALSAAQVVEELAEAQAEWDRLDRLGTALRNQRRHIATRLAAFMDFIVLVRLQVRNLNPKPRRALTSAEKILATAKLRRTRELRHTMGKRQKKALKA